MRVIEYLWAVGGIVSVWTLGIALPTFSSAILRILFRAVLPVLFTGFFLSYFLFDINRIRKTANVPEALSLFDKDDEVKKAKARRLS